MTATDSRFPPRVIVVGDRHSAFVEEVVCLAADCGLAVTPCDDVYSAAAELARHPDRFLRVTGLFGKLARYKGEFFALARRSGVPCCCLVDGESHVERDKILAAVRLGVRLAGEMADIRTFLEERLDAEECRSPEAQEDFLGEESRATADELDALLRQETDG
jgi:hypothetical protein